KACEPQEEALHIIAQKADGALRDALSIFDRIVSFSGNQITYETVIENLNILDYSYYFKIVEAIVQLSQVLDLDVVAEGIETEWQAQQLIELGCRYGQGYLFSYPLDSSAASSLLARLGEDA
ncbi:MAG: EAL domain-containing protein, partial [Cyanobacteria bacterium J06636_28]